MVEAFTLDTPPRYLLRDRDAKYDAKFRARVRSLGIEEVLTAPRSPWQNPYVERLIGSIRRESLSHIIIFNERHLKRVLRVALRVALRVLSRSPDASWLSQTVSTAR